MEALVNFVQEEFIQKKDFSEFSPGDTITVYYEIREGDKVRTQFFRGVVIQIKGQGLSKSFTILPSFWSSLLQIRAPPPPPQGNRKIRSMDCLDYS